METPAGNGYIDYRFTINELNRLIVEAKRHSRDLGVSEDHAGRHYKLNGPVFNSKHAQEGIEQAIRYCGHKNSELACITNGRQWIIFIGNRRGDGKDTLSGQAFVFGSLDGVRSNFKKFYNLLSFESVSKYRYRADFQEAEGQPLRSSSFNEPLRKPDSRILIPADRIYDDLDRVMISFFRDLSGDDDPEMRKACFVTSAESNRADASIARISEQLRNKVRTLRTDDNGDINGITQAIKRVRDMQRHEFILLVGTKGAGKSSFVDRFFEVVLPKTIASDCVLVRIDLAESAKDEHGIIKWLDEHFLEATEKAVFGDEPPDYDELKGMYFREYERMRKGPYKHLYNENPSEFKIRFGEQIEQRREQRPHEYIVHLLHRIVHSYIKIPCLIFDNADHFSVDFQEKVFQYAHSFYKEVLCLVLFPITDKTSWQISRQGALESFFTESFFLPSPAPDLVLRKRVEYIERKIKEDNEKPEKGRGYFFGRGIELTIEDLKAFTSSVQNVFINTGDVANWIGNLSNHDIRRCLNLTRDIVGSPHIHVDEMLKAITAKSSIQVDPNNAKLAMIKGKYDIYPTGLNRFVQNIFALTTEFGTSPLLGLRILQVLESTHFQHAEGEARFMQVSHIIEYCKAMNFEHQTVLGWLNNMLKSGLILSYDPERLSINEVFRIEISPSGYQHLIWGRSDWAYLESMLEVTPLRNRETFNELLSLMNVGFPFSLRSAIRLFLHYLIFEDAKYSIIPDHPQYDDQRRLVGVLEQQRDQLNQPMRVSHSHRYGRPFGVIHEWYDERGYGYITPDGGSADLFLRFRNIHNYSDSISPIGRCVEFDISRNEKGPIAINAFFLDQTLKYYIHLS
ncbi:hypothetical protein FGO68_gene13365 [Halteria grandinella]|uniref:CSD domain-containing protein n=1 Tax=Halteria grandinella TaxID=5974 RepID=A0A8J8SUM7_HALGN|nr:hypothetical protein FGO68_gene13365 [Halteria grandinella]